MSERMKDERLEFLNTCDYDTFRRQNCAGELLQALKADRKRIKELEDENKEWKDLYCIMSRACGNWREWPNQVQTDHDHPDWKAASRAIIERDLLKAQLEAQVRNFKPIYIAINEMLAVIGAAGEIDSLHEKTGAVMNALFELDKGVYDVDKFMSALQQGNDDGMGVK